MISYTAIIPAYNAQETIEECLKSILTQSVPPRHVIVVDDGSTDATVDVVHKISGEIQIIRQSNRGPGAATTAGFKAAQTEWLATLDADDLWLEDKMFVQLNFLENNPSMDMVFAHLKKFEDSSRPGKSEPGWGRTTMTVRRSAFEKLGPVVDPKPLGGEMIDWIARAREAAFKIHMLDEALCLRRIRPGSLTYGRPDSINFGYLRVAREAILRKRMIAAKKQDG